MNKLATKPTFTARAFAWLDDNWMYLACFAFAVFIILFIASREPAPYLKAPVSACRSTYTGQQRTEDVVHYQCAAFDAKTGACTVQMPVYTQVTYHEVNNLCNWNEWR